MAWRIGVLIGWVGALVGLAALDWDEASWYIAAGLPLTVLVGALIDRWWAVTAPLPVTVVWLVVALLTQDNCVSCEPMEWQVVLEIQFLIFTVPASAALATGVGLRRAGRFFRHLPPDNQHA
jgi:hypothetical protein